MMKILSASFHQGDMRFGKYRGQQCTAMSVAFLCAAAVKDPQSWQPYDLDTWLVAGNQLYVESVKKLQEENRFLENYLRPAELVRCVVVQNPTKVTFQVDDGNEICGTLHQRSSDFEISSYELAEGLRKLFADYAAAVFTTNCFSMGILRSGETIWFSDSHSRDHNGRPHLEGKAVLMQFTEIGHLASYIRGVFRENGQYLLTPVCDIKPFEDVNLVSAIEPSPSRQRNLGLWLNNAKKQKNKADKRKAEHARSSKKLTTNKEYCDISEKTDPVSNHSNVSVRLNDLESSCSLQNNEVLGNFTPTQNALNANVHSKCAFTSRRETRAVVVSSRSNTTSSTSTLLMAEPIKKRQRALQEVIRYQNNETYRNRKKEKMREYVRAHENRDKNRKANKQHYLNRPESKLKHLSNVKKRLECDPNKKAMNLANVKKRLECDPNKKARNLANVKKRLQQNPTIRENKLIYDKNRLQCNVLKKKKNLENAKAREKVLRTSEAYRQKKKELVQNFKAKARFEENRAEKVREKYLVAIKDGPTHICVCCGQLFFAKSMSVKPYDEKDGTWMKIRQVCTLRMWDFVSVYEVCLTCLSYIKRDKVNPVALINGLEFEPVPDILKGLTSLEERLVSSRLLFMKIRELGVDRQYGLQGHCINVPCDINDSVSVLPRLPTESHTLVVQLMRRMNDQYPVATENIRPELVYRVAEWLVETDLYKSHNITLRRNWISLYEIEKDLLGIGNLFANPDNDFNNDSANKPSDDVNANNVVCTTTVHTLQSGKDEPSNLVGHTDSAENRTVLDELTEEEQAMEMQETLLTAAFLPDSGIKIAPGEGKVPISLIGDSDLDALAFPTVYGGQPRKFKTRLTPVQIAKAEVRSFDRRVACHMPKMMLSFCKARTYKLSSRMNIALRKKRHQGRGVKVVDVISEQTIDNIISHDEGFRVVDVDRSSPAYWEGRKKVVMAMLRQLGCPTFFLTLSAAETKWTELHIILKKVVDNEVISEHEANQMTWQEKTRLVKSDPVTCARYFDHRFREFWKLILHPNGIFFPYKVTDFYIRYKIQFRGSVHAHTLIWLENAPQFNEEDPLSRERCEQFVDTFITCAKDDAMGDLINRQYHKHKRNCKRTQKKVTVCRFDFPRPPMRNTTILMPLDETYSNEIRKNLKTAYARICSESEKIARDDEDCSFDSYLQKLGVSEEDYILAIRSQLKKPKLFNKRNLNERKLNVYNKEILLFWRANMDLQFILNPYSTINYVNSYLTKAHKGMSRLLRDVYDQVRKGDMSLKLQLRKIINAFLNNSEISAQEIALHLLSIPMSKCSRSQIYINTSLPEERVHLLKSKAELQKLYDSDPNSENITVDGLFEHYIQRPDVLEKLCLADFAAMYTFQKSCSIKNSCDVDEDKECSSDNNSELDDRSDETEKHSLQKPLPLKDGSGFVIRRKRRKIIRFRNYNQGEDEMNYYREQLMLFTSWRLEPCLESNVKKHFFRYLDQIKNNRKHYCKYSDIFDNIPQEELIDEEESDDEQDSNAQVEGLAIFDVNDTPADINVEISGSGDDHSSAQRIDSFLLPKFLPEDDYLSLIQKLNFKQRRFLLDMTHKIKTKPDEQQLVFVSGSAGVGKSVLISSITQSLLRFWTHQLENSPDDLHLLLCAPTGKAAFNIGGVTIHSAFHLGFNLSNEGGECRKLNADTRNAMFCKYSKLKMIIIDEASMVGCKMLKAINRCLQDIFQNTKPFGGLSVILFGDLNQLQPVKDSWIFEEGFDIVSGLIGAHLWSLFELYELTEIMRQKDDAVFAKALNNLALGETTSQENELFKSRELARLNLRKDEVMNEVVAIYHKNKDVDDYNRQFLAKMSTTGCISDAFDRCVGPGSVNSKKKVLEYFRSTHHSRTQGLPTTLILKIDARYVLSTNLDVKEGLTNGTPCVLKHITFGQNQSDMSSVPFRLYVEFENASIGSELRCKFKNRMAADGVSLKWTPIERINKTVTIAPGSMLKVARNQFPLKPAQAMTIHTSQGSTYTKILTNVQDCQRRLIYTALSRVTSLNGLFIEGNFTPPPKTKINSDKVFLEMNRMRNESPYKFSCTFPEDLTENCVLATFFNTRSLTKYFELINKDYSFNKCDIVMLVETRTNSAFQANFENFACVFRKDGLKDCNLSYGCMALVKRHLENTVSICFDESLFQRRRSCVVYVDVVGLAIDLLLKKIGIIFVYKSPHCPVETFISVLNNAVSSYKKLTLENLYIVGDFNIDFFKESKDKEILKIFMNNNALVLCSPVNCPTTNNHSQIDLCFSNVTPKYSFLLESVISDHKALWFAL